MTGSDDLGLTYPWTEIVADVMGKRDDTMSCTVTVFPVIVQDYMVTALVFYRE